LTVLGDSGSHGLSERKAYQILNGEPRAHILQQLEDNVSVQSIREMQELGEIMPTLSVPGYKQTVYWCDLQ
jgi:hypothetical protein